MSVSPLPALVLAALCGLAACGGPVATNAPGLLTLDQIAARSAGTGDTVRGMQAQAQLEHRGARLRARAAQLRRAGLDENERSALLRRADQLKSR